MPKYKERIICLSEETTESLYRMGMGDRVVGVSSHTVRPAEARSKPKISSFIKVKVEEIMDLKPDLILGFSDVQAELAQTLIKAGLEVYIFNHRTIEGILNMVRTLAGLTGELGKGELLVEELESNLADYKYQGKSRPKVYFEEWLDPIITGIGWVSELIEIAGGRDVFSELARESKAENRVIKPSQVVEKNPDLILASWCGKAFNEKKLLMREGWDTITAIKNKEYHEINSSLILQPGPACILEGLPCLKERIDSVRH